MSTIAALSIAGSDPSGGAGIQADLKVFERLGVYGMAIPTLLTAQNTKAVEEVLMLETDFVKKQLDTILSDIKPQAIKTGALGNSAIIPIIADRVKDLKIPLVVDPIFKSTASNKSLIKDDNFSLLREVLLTQTTLVTPNTKEASILVGFNIETLADLEKAALSIVDYGPQAVLIKGGHLKTEQVIDVFLHNGEFQHFKHTRVKNNIHGTGCVLSAAITAYLAKNYSLQKSVSLAEEFISKLIKKCQNSLLLSSKVDKKADE